MAKKKAEVAQIMTVQYTDSSDKWVLLIWSY